MTVYLGDKAVGVNTIVVKGDANTKFGVSIDNLFGTVNENGLYTPATETFNLDFTGITGFSQPTNFSNYFSNNNGIQDFIWSGIANISDNKLEMQNCFKGSSLKNAYLDDLETIVNAGSYLFWSVFQDSSLETLTWKLKTVNSGYSCYAICSGCKQLTSTALDNLEEISGASAFSSGFSNCIKLTTTGLVKLKKINGNTACQRMFYFCTGLTKEYFYELVEVSPASAMDSMFLNCTNLTELHFRADAQAVIEAQSGYASRFGAPETCTIYFDL